MSIARAAAGQENIAVDVAGSRLDSALCAAAVLLVSSDLDVLALVQAFVSFAQSKLLHPALGKGRPALHAPRAPPEKRWPHCARKTRTLHARKTSAGPARPEPT